MSNRGDGTPDTGQAARAAGTLSARQAAMTLGVHERTVRRAISRGALPATKVGGTFRISPDALTGFHLRTAPTQPSHPIQTVPAPGEAILLPVLRSESAPVLSLPAPLTPLVGRDAEAKAVTGLIRRQDVRLVTLTGPGGIGKTRLALRVASELTGAFAGGMTFVSLAGITDPSLVAPAIAGALAVREGDQPLIARLRAAIRDRELLLILDNFERVLTAAPDIADLLGSCPGLTILVTSRAALNVSGEQRFPVPPLDVPPLAAITSETGLAATAVRLFCARARAVQPDFVLTDDNAAAVATVCTRLDGLPLAIELAAARSTLLSPAALLARLSPSLGLLTGGPRDQPARHRTMAGAIAWSYDLLTPDEQALFRRLSVFAGGCTLEAAAAVAGPSLPSSVLGSIASLVDHQLLRRADQPDGEPRFTMLETIREFAGDRLAESGETEECTRRHADFFVAFAERYELAELLPDGDRVLALLDAEHANLRAALAHLDEAGEAELFARLAAALGIFWSSQGHYLEGRRWLEAVLAHGPAIAAADRAKALVRLGIIATFQAAYRDAEGYLREGLALSPAVGDGLLVANALLGLGALAIQQGDDLRGVALLEECRTAAAAMSDRRLAEIIAGCALINLADADRARGDHIRAAARLEEALRLVRAGGYATGTILALGDLGDLARDAGEHARALEFYREALKVGRGSPSSRVVIDAIAGVATVAAAVGLAERAARLLGATEVLREYIGYRYRTEGNTVAHPRAMAASRAALGESAFAIAWAAGRTLRAEQAVAEALAPFAPAAAPLHAALTPREAQILPLLAAGQADREIGAALFISVRTVENHVAHILAKLGVATRAAAVDAALAAGLVSPGDAPPA